MSELFAQIVFLLCFKRIFISKHRWHTNNENWWISFCARTLRSNYKNNELFPNILFNLTCLLFVKSTDTKSNIILYNKPLPFIPIPFLYNKLLRRWVGKKKKISKQAVCTSFSQSFLLTHLSIFILSLKKWINKRVN